MSACSNMQMRNMVNLVVTRVLGICKTIIILGQDESIYNQFSFGSKQWVGNTGKRAFLPKSDGAGAMISAFQFREFGWGLKLTPEQLREINEKRKKMACILTRLPHKMF